MDFRNVADKFADPDLDGDPVRVKVLDKNDEFESPEDELETKNVPRTQKRELNRYRLFYKTYPQIGETVPPQLKATLNSQLSSINEKEVIRQCS